MVTNRQIRRLRKLMQRSKNLMESASKAGMDEKTARKYLHAGKLPSELAVEHGWRTRADPFEEIWDDLKEMLGTNPGLEAKTLFEHLQRRYAGRFTDGQLRTLQRRVKMWRALEGPAKEVFFPQIHFPGELCESDFTSMNELGIILAGQPFDHLLYHFVLPYSNWETGQVCFSECFESLSAGLQEALWELGGVPKAHRTDWMSTAVQKAENPEEFTARYQGLLKHLRMEGRKIQAREPHENGDVEQGHHRLKRAVDQALMLRGSREFANREEYREFLKMLFRQLNQGRQKRLAEELAVLRRLPELRLEACRRLEEVRVSSGSTIPVLRNVYSVDSRLRGERVNVRVYADYLEVWYAQRCVERIPRLRGEGKHHIQYRHIIDWLVRKPGAFEHYRYRSDLFPTSVFRMAYDNLRAEHASRKAAKEYLEILQMAAKEGESLVEDALGSLFDASVAVSAWAVAMVVEGSKRCPSVKTEVTVDAVNLGQYDGLFEQEAV